MNVRTVPSVPRRQLGYAQPQKPKKSFRVKIRLFFVVAICFAVIWGALAVIGINHVSADVSIGEIRSAVAGYCLDDYKSSTKSGSPVYSWRCNGARAENWQVVGSRIKLANQYCLGVIQNKVVIDNCSGSKNQQWSRRGAGFENLANSNCLSLAGNNHVGQVITASCSDLTNMSESWTSAHWSGLPLSAISSPTCKDLPLGKRVACYANRQWLAWETEPKLHNILLTDYTDRNPYEEWCADFISYIYREAGAPFSNGERGKNGWDEYNANNIQYMGFTYHAANSGYVPRAGDIAFFDYAGGHVEIVVSGGAHPTFIYGDSGTIDPMTGNGNMAKNQIVNDGSAGHVVYYLSPN
jgi:hypothetical protein